MFTRGEAAAVSVVSFLAAAIAAAYIGDACGWSLHPLAILGVALAAATAITVPIARGELVEPRARPSTRSGRAPGPDFVLFILIVFAVLLLLAWRAWPDLLPIGAGPDLTHHLLLVDYIDRTGHLVHDRTLGGYLGEMADYTPGLHVLAVLAGRWTGRDGLHAVFSVVAMSFALKVGVIFLIALRCLAKSLTEHRDRVALGTAAVFMLAFPQLYVLGSFVHDSYLPQVVSELFACTMWLAILVWDDRPSLAAVSVFAVAGVGAFFTWPVWIGPPIVTFAVVLWLQRDRPRAERMLHAAVALAPIALVAGIYLVGRLGASAIVASGGAVPSPRPSTVGWLLLTLGPTGALVAAADRRARTIPILLGAILLQALALVLVARARHAAAPYLALKMAYLGIYPLILGATYALSVAVRRSPRGIVWAIPAALLVAAAQSVRAMPRRAPVITDALYDAGRWTRTHVPPSCVDYLVADDDSAYWLHLAVLGNPRAGARATDSDTYDPQKALERWVLPGGLPYAIVENYEALPRDIRNNVDVLERFGAAALVKRRGPASCVSVPRDR